MGCAVSDYEIPREGPMPDCWEQAVHRFDWCIGVVLAAWALYVCLPALLAR